MGCGFPTVCGVVAGPLSVPDNPANWQSLETLGFPVQAEPRVLAMSASAYQRGVSLLLADFVIVAVGRSFRSASFNF